VVVVATGLNPLCSYTLESDVSMRMTYVMGSRSRIRTSAARSAGASTFSSLSVRDDVKRMFTATPRARHVPGNQPVRARVIEDCPSRWRPFSPFWSTLLKM
jgi:hypothetical protein